MRQRVAVFIMDNGTVLLIRRRKNSKEYYAVPGGGMEPGENEEDVAVREIKEETGLDIVLGKKLGAIELDGGMQHFYLAKSFRGTPALGGPEKGRQSPDNIYNLEWVPLETLDQIELRGEIKTLLYKHLNPNEASSAKAPKRLNSILIPYRVRNGMTEVYLQRRPKDAVRLPDHFGFFGGGAEKDETPEQALMREIKEELGYVPRGYHFFGEHEFAGNKKWVYIMAAPDDFESKIRILEGQYGKWFTDKEIAEESLLIEDDKKILRAVIAAISMESQFLGETISVVIDRPLGSKHQKWGFVYEVNYGYVPNTKGGDGEEVDAYILGVSKPLKEFSGKCIAVIHRTDDDDDKLIVAPEGKNFIDDDIRSLTDFQEKYFKSVIIR